MNFNHLYYFYITGLSKNATEAAKRLRISQPSLCSQLKTLEDCLQVKLFKKDGRNRLLTDSGEEVFSFCKRMFHVSDELGEYILDKNAPPQKCLRIGVVEDIESSFISNVVDAFLSSSDEQNRLRICSYSGQDKELIDRLKLRELDIVVSSKKANDNELSTLTSVDSPIVFIASSKNRAHDSWNKFDCIKELINTQNMPFILPNKKFEFRHQIDSFMRENRINIKVALETDNISLIVRSVINEVGVAFIPLAYLDEDVRKNSLKIFNPRNHLWQHTIYLRCNAVSSLNDTNIDFAKCFNLSKASLLTK